MTTTQSGSAQDVAPVELVEVTIDGITTHVAKGTLIIRAAEQLGIAIPRFCDHPLLAPAGACRQCLVEVAMPGRDGNLAAMPKPQASCTMECTPGMVVKTQLTSEVSTTAQHGVMELLLINHPLDCPVCDKGGECPLQNQAMSNGRATSRFHDVKRTYAKPLAISTQILLDRERCILCQRCTRFQDEIAGDPFIDLQMRGAAQQIGRFDTEVLGFAGELPTGDAQLDTSGRPFSSYFSGNTIQICPVGALTSAAYRFRARPFDLVSTPSIAEHDACGAAIRIDHRRGVVLRRLAGEDPAVNEEWISDKDRFAFRWQSAPDRLTAPLVREDDTLIPTSWPDAFATAAEALRTALGRGAVAALPGGRVTVEDAFAWSAFARIVLGTNDVDFRARAHSDEEADFLAAVVAGTGLDVTYAELERAPHVLLAGLEPEEEAATIFLRLRKGVLAGRVQVATLAPLVSRGASKLRARWLPAAPGTEAEVLDSLTAADLGDDPTAAVVLVGERLAGAPGALSAVVRLAQRTGARVAWVPRRAGDRGAVEVGLLPTLLPGGRPVDDDGARADVAARWGVASLPSSPGRDLAGIVEAARAGELAGLVVGGLDLDDLPDPAAAREALAAVRAAGGVVIQLEVRRSEVTSFADVVLPVAPPVEKAGTFLTWEGRPRAFERVFDTSAFSDGGVLAELADLLGRQLPRPEVWPAWTGARVAAPELDSPEPVSLPPGRVVLATWRLLLDAGRGQDGEPHLAGTAHRAVARLAPETAEALGLADADEITVRGSRGAVRLPLVQAPMAEHVVWLPQHAPGVSVHAGLGAQAGDVVEVLR